MLTQMRIIYPDFNPDVPFPHDDQFLPHFDLEDMIRNRAALTARGEASTDSAQDLGRVSTP